jgi:protein involved in polysaccharide export with SLBB domain
MTYEEALRLHPGDEVRWTDPDAGACSKIIKIASIEAIDDAFCVVDEDGSVLECFPEELS